MSLQSAKAFAEKIKKKHPEARIESRYPTTGLGLREYRVVWKTRSTRDASRDWKATAKSYARKASSKAKAYAGKAKSYASKKYEEHKTKQAGKKHFYVLLFNYPKGDRDRKLKGTDGPFSTKVHADKVAAEESAFYPRVVYITPALFERVKNASSYDAEKVLHGAWKKETGYKVSGDRHQHRAPGAPSFAKQKLISKKIRLLVREGYDRKQAAAIAYRTYGVSRTRRDA